MTLKKGGFLSSEAIYVSSAQRKKHKRFLDLAHTINRFAEETKQEIAAHNRNAQEIVSGCLFIRILEGCQSVILQVERGFDLDAAVTLRVVFEALVYLKLSSEDEVFVQEYLILHDAKRLQLTYKALKYSEDETYVELLKSIEKEESIDKVVQKIRNQLIAQGIPAENLKELKPFLNKFKIHTLAEKAGFLRLYRTLYYQTSMNTHTASKTLERYIAIDNDGQLTHFMHGPHFGNAEIHLSTTSEFLLTAIGIISNLFNLDKEKKVMQFVGRFKSI